MRITLDRPATMNALSLDMLRELKRLVDEIGSDPSVHAVLLDGAGESFCSGGDLGAADEFRASETTRREFYRAFAEAVTGFEQLRQPVVALVQGWVLAGGLELVLGCDVVLADDTARLGDQHIVWGLVPGAGSTQRLARKIGPSRARDLLFTGRWITAEEALRFGLVARVYAAETAQRDAWEFVSTLARRSPQALAIMKQLVRDGADAPLAVGLAAEVEAGIAYADHPDFVTAVEGFENRTPPSYA